MTAERPKPLYPRIAMQRAKRPDVRHSNRTIFAGRLQATFQLSVYDILRYRPGTAVSSRSAYVGSLDITRCPPSIEFPRRNASPRMSQKRCSNDVLGGLRATGNRVGKRNQRQTPFKESTPAHAVCGTSARSGEKLPNTYCRSLLAGTSSLLSLCRTNGLLNGNDYSTLIYIFTVSGSAPA